jgi:acylphosphatase
VSAVKVTVRVSGRVQGVGFRYWTREAAERLGLRGSATNLPDGRVEIIAEGPRARCVALLDELRGDGPPGFVGEIADTWSESQDEPHGFRVR